MKLDADIDLAKLAATLPKSLRMRDRTELRDGKLVVKVESRSTPQGTAWTGQLNSTSIRAMRDGHEVKWDEPISIEFAGRYRPHHLPTFDTLICRSEFAAIQAEVLPDSFRAAANLDLDKLASRLSEFVDLDGTTMSGRGTLSVVARRDADQAYKADASLELKQFALARPQGKSLKEPQLSLHISASGRAPEGGAISAATGQVTLTSGRDECQFDACGTDPGCGTSVIRQARRQANGRSRPLVGAGRVNRSPAGAIRPRRHGHREREHSLRLEHNCRRSPFSRCW